MDSRETHREALLLIQLYRSPEDTQDDLRLSVANLQSDLNAAGAPTVLWKSDEGVEYFDPPTFMDIATVVASGGVGIAVYRILRLWLDGVNGRRFRIRIGEIEVEATQLPKQQFLQLISDVLELRKSIPDFKASQQSSLDDQDGVTASTFLHRLTPESFRALLAEEDDAGNVNRQEGDE